MNEYIGDEADIVHINGIKLIDVHGNIRYDNLLFMCYY